MTDPVNVEDNIKRLNESKVKVSGDIDSLKEQIKFAKEELIRLEGCLIVFNGFKEAGIKNIVDSSTNTKEVEDIKSHTHENVNDLYSKYRTM